MKPFFTTGLLIAASCIPAAAQDIVNKQCTDVLYQVSTIGRLLEGAYDGISTFQSVMARGDFGLGTFDGLDGEMIAVDGKYFQVKEDGIAYPVSKDMLTPFAAVTFFEPGERFTVDSEISCNELQEVIKTHFTPEGSLYAIKITGEFSSLKTRSVPAQQKPYEPLVYVLPNQVVFNFENVEATLAGFWFSEDLSQINAPGFHFHAITENSMAGGHVLDCNAYNVLVEIDPMDEVRIKFNGLEQNSRETPPCPDSAKRTNSCRNRNSCR